MSIPFYYLGFLYKTYEETIYIKWKYVVLPIIVLLVSVRWRIDISTNQYVNPIFYLVNSISGIYLILLISKSIATMKAKLYEVLQYIGRRTIVIMAFQFLGFYVGNELVREYNFEFFQYYWVLISTTGVVIPLIMDRFLDSCNINSSTLQRNYFRPKYFVDNN
jgi:fucose 4-O-acetylase-like acetyltransferase